MRVGFIGFIGAGTMGAAMGKLLADGGYDVGYFSRTKDSAVKAARFSGGESFDDRKQLAGISDVLLITTCDDAIAGVARELADEGSLKPGQIVAHMSGSLSSKVLEPVTASDALILSMHPLQSCASPDQAVKNLPGSVFSLEGDAAAVEKGEEIVRSLGGRCVELKAEDKALYHAGACMASNYLVTLFDLASDAMLRAGMEEEKVSPALMPLVLGTCANLEQMPPREALTGPIARGDVGTVRGHLEIIRQKAPQLLQAYCVLGLHAVRIAQEKGTLGPETAGELRRLLEV